MPTKKAPYVIERRPIRMNEGGMSIADVGEDLQYRGGQYFMERKASPAGAGRGFINPPIPNSREQYEMEREVGDPNALRLSFEEWKKL